MNIYRSDHVGSLLRPQTLLDARKAYAAGTLARDALRDTEDAAILKVVGMQRSAGIEVVSDGEFRRSSFLAGPYEALAGLAAVQGAYSPVWHGVGEAVANQAIPIAALVATGKLSLTRRITGEETPFMKRHAGGPYKVTMPGPTMYLTLFRPGVTDAVYRDPQEMLNDLVRLYQMEVDAQIADGASYIQLDSLRYAQALSGALPGPGHDASDGAASAVAQAVAADNAIFSRARGKGVIRAIHICRGNHRSAWLMSGGYGKIAEQLFNLADVDRFLLEFDDERSGGFEPLRFMPKGKIAVLGLVTTKVGRLESQDSIMRRVDDAARYLPLEQLALSPQCGFASTALGNLLTEDEQKRKLELIVDTARRIWG
jgi:5-methyltetrahydropteroyltriglutamate--homocysteine methyltransferase